MKKLKETYERSIILTDKNGKKFELVLYHNFINLKNQEAFNSFIESNPKATLSFEEYVKLLNKLEFEKDLSVIYADRIKKSKLYRTAIIALDLDITASQSKHMLYDCSLDDDSYFINTGAEFVKQKSEEYSKKITALQNQISLIKYSAKTCNIALNHTEKVR